MFSIAPSARLRPSPFYAATLAEGVTSFTTYNHMLMPTGYGDPEAEYWRLIEGVSQWDVSVERQVELKGPDAGRLAQILAPREFGDCQSFERHPFRGSRAPRRECPRDGRRRM